jgi:hypothetical protein
MRLRTRYLDYSLSEAMDITLDPSCIEFMSTCWESMKDVFALIDILEPRIARMIWSPNHLVTMLGRLNSYFQSVLRWEQVIVRLAPRLQEQIERIELCHRAVHRFLQLYQDFVTLRGDPFNSLLASAIFLEDVVNMGHLDSVDEIKNKATINIIERQLRFLLARQFNLKKPWKKLSSEDKIHLSLLNSTQGVSACIAPQHRIAYSVVIWRYYLQNEDTRYCQNEGLSTVPQCVERIPELDEIHHELHASRDTPSCFCAWIIACVPECLLSVFGCNVRQLSSLFHDTNHPFYSIRKLFAPLARSFRFNNSFLTSTLGAVFRYSIRLTVAKTLRKLAADTPCETVAPLDTEELLGYILIQSLGLLLVFIRFCGNAETSAPDNFADVKKRFGLLATMRAMAEEYFGMEYMDGVW